jgi:hypothetical protein
MKRVLGMNKWELDDWAKTRSGVGPGQESLYAGYHGWMGGGDGV